MRPGRPGPGSAAKPASESDPAEGAAAAGPVACDAPAPEALLVDDPTIARRRGVTARRPWTLNPGDPQIITGMD